MTDDGQLLREFVANRSEPAFRELVTRHIDLVYSAALRVVNGDRHMAEDITQSVFADLARKAGTLSRDVLLPGWLYQHTCFTAAKVVRTESRRRNREQTAMDMSALTDSRESPWEEIAPHLDEAMNQLSAADRDAVMLRFFKRQDFRAVGSALGISEDAAQKRVSRALEKLHGLLSQRGVALTVSALASTLVVQTVTAAPSSLAASVTAASLAGTAGTGGIATFKLMALTKFQTTVAGVLLVGGIATLLVVQHQSLNRAHKENTALRQQLTKAEQLPNLNPEAAALDGLTAAQLSELLRLRADAGRLRQQIAELQKSRTGNRLSDLTAAENSEITIPPELEGAVGDYPRESWTFKGFATPQAGVESHFWAEREGDVTMYLDCFTPEMRSNIWVRDKSESEIRKGILATDAVGFRIVAVSPGPRENEVLLTVTELEENQIVIDGQSRSSRSSRNMFNLLMQKRGNEWKWSRFLGSE